MRAIRRWWRVSRAVAGALLFAIGEYGLPFIMESPEQRAKIMTWLSSADDFFRGGHSPTLMLLGALLFFTALPSQKLVRRIIGRRLNERRDAFFKEFNELEIGAARQIVRL